MSIGSVVTVCSLYAPGPLSLEQDERPNPLGVRQIACGLYDGDLDEDKPSSDALNLLCVDAAARKTRDSLSVPKPQIRARLRPASHPQHRGRTALIRHKVNLPPIC